VNRKAKVPAFVAGGLLALAISLGIAWWGLRYQAYSGTEKPNAPDWLGGWGTIFGLVVTTIGAVVAGLVYYESVKAAWVAEQRRLEDREEAREAAAVTEARWRREREGWNEQTMTLRQAESQRRDKVRRGTPQDLSGTKRGRATCATCRLGHARRT
jgi:hypothetical protein